MVSRVGAVERAARPAAPVIDIDALFPGGGDRPLTVTFAHEARPAAQPQPPVMEARPAAPPAVPPALVDPAASSPVAGTAGATPQPAAAPQPPALVSPAVPVVSVAAPPPPALNEPGRRQGDTGASVDIGHGTPLPFTSTPPVVLPAHAVAANQPVPAQAVVLQQHLDLAHDGAWLDSLARDIARSVDGDGRLRFRLNPAHLGSLHVELANGANGTSIHLTAETEAARAILADSRHHLVAETRAQGLRVAETRIDVADTGGQGANPGHGQHRQGGDHAQMASPQQNLLTILPQTRPVAGGGASSASVRERYA
ncbi:MAG TPA: flagellar hook-length control protein FliK [Sphingomonadaceae bacterium]|nr:flagellar hook-length control protein FliK [Sphingomonadaceae bacterium]